MRTPLLALVLAASACWSGRAASGPPRPGAEPEPRPAGTLPAAAQHATSKPAPPPADTELVRRINRYVAPLEAELSGTLLVARGGRVLLERSFGYASWELRVPFTPATPTNVASITKPLTIIIAARLQEAHRLSWADTVARWLPEYVHGRRMTVDLLLNHRAGVPHRLLPESAQAEPRTASDMVRLANALPLDFETGTRNSYSSGGYALLAAILERAGGEPYDELLQHFVAQPVHARVIRHVDARHVLPGRASSIMPAGDVVLNAPLRDLSFLVGGGSVYTTPRDILLVMEGLVRSAYGADAKAALLRDTGLQWNGVTNGFRAFADWYAADSVAVLFFGNAHTGGIDLLRRELPRIVRGESVAPPLVPKVSAVALPEAARRRLEGEYDVGGAVNSLRFVSPSLAVLGDRALAVLDDSTLYSFADYARVTFVSAPAGGVAAIQWGPGTWGTGEAGPRFARVTGR